jgi:radical SAM protein with 4Fe4S-binding SPASM domain
MRSIVDRLGYVPKTCTWELTLRCNLNCGHCGSRAGRARAQEMPRTRALEVVAELRALGCERLTLSGGEPTLSPHWEAVAEEGSRLGIHVNLITNGLHPVRDLVRRAKNVGLNSIGTSLEGMRTGHDANRGRAGLFRRAMELLDAAQAEGFPIAVVTTLTRQSARDLSELHELLATRVYAWQLQLGAAMGNLGDRREAQLEPRDLLTVIPLVASLIRTKRVPIYVGDNLGYYGPHEPVLRTRRSSAWPCWVGCYAGCRHLGIEADGGVKGCLSIQSSDQTEGNLQRESLRDIWLRPGAFAYNRAFSLADLDGFCRTCQYAEICRGGCLSMRSCEGGRDNPFCYHRVATLEARARRGRSRYSPVALLPAALLAVLGAGCGGQVEQDPTDAGTAATDARPDGPRNLVDAYGVMLRLDGAPDAWPGVDAYGLQPDVGPVDHYGIIMPTDAYGLPQQDASPDAQPDVGPVDDYGMPMPDAGAPADAAPDAQPDVGSVPIYALPG